MSADSTALPGSLWRRFAAALYDAMLLLALWMTSVLVAGIAQDLMHIPNDTRWEHRIQIYLFVLGLLMFGWFWTHGGQTPGLKAWQLRLQRDNGRALRWPIAAIRYAGMLLCWSISLAPLLLLATPLKSSHPALAPVAWSCLVLLLLGCVISQLDPKRRSPQDYLAGTRIVAAPHARRSTNTMQSPQSDQHENHGSGSG